MADVEIIGSSFDLSYKRTTYEPIDKSSVFKTREDARVYALNNSKERAYVPYCGQIISVLETNEVYKLVPAVGVEEIEERKGKPHYDLALIGSSNEYDDRYLRRDIAENVKKLMTFLEGINAQGVSTLEQITLLKDIVSKNFSAGSTGFGITQDASGNYHLDIDFVNIRRKLTVSEIQVQQSSYIGGKQWNTAAGMICSAVEDKGDRWRCYFKTTDAEGRTVRNTWALDDQALCETFNLIDITGAVDNHQYWRLVVGKGDDYIELSKSKCMPYSDTPRVGDNIVQLGNPRDTERQGAICWDSVTEGGPYVRVYKGINSYHLPQPTIDLNPEHSVIKAKLTSEATGKDIDVSLNDIIRDVEVVRTQTDRQFVMWFEDYVPTLNNLPASDWKTEADRLTHEQDLFYNTSKNAATGGGRAYRFEKVSGEWKWKDVTDKDTIAALEAASRAQDTADGKRRVFVEQPTDAKAYDVGDMWVNATITVGNTKYSNDTLVCKTAKAAGAAFSIDHWKPASTATTAYLANLGDMIIGGVADAEDKIAALKKLAEDGIKDAKGIANDAIEGLGNAMNSINGLSGDMDERLGALSGRINGVNSTLTEHTTSIRATRDAIALLAEGKEKDANGNVVQISKGGLVTTAYFNTLFSERVEFDKNGHIVNTAKSGLVTTADFSELFAEKATADGYVKKAYIDLFITDNKDGTFTSNARVSADKITLEGLVTANSYFKILKDGSMEANKGTFKGDIIQGNGINQMHADGSVSFANGKIRWGVDGQPVFEGKVTTAMNGTRIEISPAENSIFFFDSANVNVGELGFGDFSYEGTTNTTPVINLRSTTSSNGSVYTNYEIYIKADGIDIMSKIHDASVSISPHVGIVFKKNGKITKFYGTE